MNTGVFLTIATTGFTIAFFHAAIPTHWLPFVAAARVQKWSHSKTLMVTAIAGSGHVLFTTLLGVLVVWLGLEVDKKIGELFPLVAGGALILLGGFYLFRQVKGYSHGHHHVFAGHSHEHSGAPSIHSLEIVQGEHGGPMLDTGHGFVEVSVFETGVPPCFRLYFYDSNKRPLVAPVDEVVKIETDRSEGERQTFVFQSKDKFLESTSEIPEPHEFEVILNIEHRGHAHSYRTHFKEDHQHGEGHQHHEKHAEMKCESIVPPIQRSDWMAIVSLFLLLTFSPCEGFLPVYLSGIRYGWGGFAILSLILASATLAGMVLFTWLTLLGLQNLKIDFFERYESGVLGGVLVGLGALVVLFEH